MKKLTLKFNPDYMVMRDVKDASQILRDLIRERELIKSRTGGDFSMSAEAFLNAFDTIAQNLEVE